MSNQVRYNTRSRARQDLVRQQSTSSAVINRGAALAAYQVPILTLGSPGNVSNFSKFREAAYTHLTIQYGLAARVLVDNKVPKPPLVFPVDSSDSSDDEQDSVAVDGDQSESKPSTNTLVIDSVLRGEIRRLSTLEAVKAQQKEKDEIRKNLPKIYAFIWERMSHESRAKVKDTAKDFADIEYNSDIVRLWQVIIDTHLVGVHPILAVAKSQTLHRYYAMSQGASETLIDFKRRIDDQLVAIKTLGIPDIPEDILAADLISKLYPGRWKEFQTGIQNSTARGYDQYPATLQEAYDAAHTHKICPTVTSNSVSSTAFVSNSYRPSGGSTSSASSSKSRSNHGNHKVHKRPHSSSHSSPISISSGSSDGRKSFMKEDGRYREGSSNTVSTHHGTHSSQTGGGSASSASTTPSGPVRLPPPPNHGGSQFRHQSARMMICRTAFPAGNLNRSDILLDNQATQSIFANRALLKNLNTIDVTHVFEGVTPGNKLRTNMVGEYCDFKNVFFHKKATANLLSMSDATKYMDVKYDQWSNSFIVTADNGNQYKFKHSNGLYVMSHQDRIMNKSSIALVTVSDKEGQYSQRQVANARKAYELMRILGRTNPTSAIRAINAANNNPCTIEDFRLANEIYGPPLSAVRGGTVKKQSVVVAPSAAIPVHEVQSMHVDLLQVNSTNYLLSATTPLGLLMISCLGKAPGAKTVASIKKALFSQLNEYKARRFDVAIILCDGEGGVSALRGELNEKGIVLNIVAAGQHVPYIERRIREVKEHARGIFNGLEYDIPDFLEQYILESAVHIINMIPHTGGAVNVSPRELFTGYRVDVNTHFRIAFGDYAEVTNPYSNNSMRSRTEPAIAVGYSGNIQGSVKFFTLNNCSFTVRDQFRVMPTNQYVVNKMNRIAHSDRNVCNGDLDFVTAERKDAVLNDLMARNIDITGAFLEADISNNMNGVINPTVEMLQSDGEPLQPVTVKFPIAPDDTLRTAAPNIVDVPMMPININVHANTPDTAVEPVNDMNIDDDDDDDVPSLVSNHMDNDDIDIKDEVTDEDDDTIGITEVQDIINEEDGRSLRSRYRGERKYYHHITGVPITKEQYEKMDVSSKVCVNMSVKEAMAKMPVEAEKAIKAELQQLIDKEVFRPAMYPEYKDQEKVESFSFMKEKKDPEGVFEKMKGRVVAIGSSQDKDDTVYAADKIASPTVNIIHVFVICLIAAMFFHPKFTRSVDVPGAFLHAPMKNKRVFMVFRPDTAKILVELKPEYKEYLRRDGSLVVEVLKAMYGLIQSPKLWFDHVSGTFIDKGFVSNPVDECVLNKEYNGYIITVAIYVDDILMTCGSMEGIEHATDILREAYGDITIKDGNVQSYLGMTIDFSVSNVVTFTMSGYIDNLLSFTNTDGYASSPASNKLFDIDTKSPLLDEATAKYFHTAVAKVLYLSKRVRPDLLPAVSFLTSRVQAPTTEDLGKLNRMLKYINFTKHVGMRLSVYDDLKIICSIDASYGVHPDGKSHAGMVLSLGRGPVLAKSSKIKIVTKSSCESELMAVTEHIGEGLSLKEFIYYQGIDVGPIILLQDNMSTIHMIKNGRGSSSKSKHISIRNFWITDRVKNGDIIVEYQPTNEMDADMLSKALVGEKFTTAVYRLLNWEI